MIDPVAAKAVIEQYTKHGWVLRRVLFSTPLSVDVAELAGAASSYPSKIDAFWFSRRSQPGSEAWELRRLSGSPFALVEVIDDGTAPDDFETVLQAVERRMSSLPSGPVSH
jgi:hypothetical protein